MTDSRRPIPGFANVRDSRKSRRYASAILALVLFTGFLAGCSPDPDPEPPGLSFSILTGSENRILFDDPSTDEPTLIERFEEAEGVDLVPSFQGSVDTMIDIQEGAIGYDAVWPASSVWMNLGNGEGVVSQVDSIMGTAVVFGIKRSKAEELGWIDRPVTVEDILAAAESGDLRYMMSSATQSNSGAMAYLGYLYAFAGHPEVLTAEDLQDPEVQDKVTRLLGEVDRTAGASGFLRDVFLSNYDSYDGMVNNESAIITANQRLIAEGETDLLQVIYPIDGLAFADWPLGYVDRGDPEIEAIFQKFKAYLLTDEIQQELVDQGRRPTKIGFTPTYDPEVFNADWGVDVDQPFTFINVPTGDVVFDALHLYQSEFRKPAFTAVCLDYSGSMKGSGERDLESAMEVMLENPRAQEYFIERATSDVTVVIPFDSDIDGIWRVNGNDPAALSELLTKTKEKSASGGTDMYRCLNTAMDQFDESLDGYSPSIVVLTDGKSDGSIDSFAARQPAVLTDRIPVYSIMFGDASEEQLTALAELTSGAVYDGREGLIDALRKSFANTS